MSRDYVQTLTSEAKERYLKKISLIGNIDPLSLGEKGSFVGVEAAALPPVDASDLVSYLVLQTSFITAKQFKAHKSLEAYNQFTSGWVKDVKSWKVSGKTVVTGKVCERCF